MAANSATATDQTPPTADSEVGPHCGCDRKSASIIGRMNCDISRLTRTTVISGSTAIRIEGRDGAAAPRAISAGSNSRAVVASSRTVRSSDAARAAPLASPLNPSPARCARPWRSLSHHMPKPNITSAATIPRPGAANGVVPKNGIGIAFWIAGVPGSADMVKVEVPSATAAGSRRRGTPPARNSATPIGASTKNATHRLTPP